ncbi:MAG: acetolactate decarboxylase [Flavobacteriales bacterium]|nr:acetolactate decarboxylase [Flavobacteriales bacterium]
MRIILISIVGSLLSCSLHAQVIPTGAMRRTMWEGQLAGLIAMDSIAGPGMYGIGPLEHLRGEITMVDGRCFVSYVLPDGTVRVEERSDVKAPFFVRASVTRWDTVTLPSMVVDLPSLDAFLTEWAKMRTEPFTFRLRGLVGDAHVHVMNVPPGTTINGPGEAHSHQVVVHDRNNEGTLVGFFSTKHKAVFTHHDTNIHVHYISWDQKLMGHLDVLRIDPARVVLEVGR